MSTSSIQFTFRRSIPVANASSVPTAIGQDRRASEHREEGGIGSAEGVVGFILLAMADLIVLLRWSAG
jgi:hypothetical protein